MTVFKLDELNSGVVFREAYQRSAFIQSGVEVREAPRGATVFTTTLGPISFDEHEFGDDEDKTTQPTDVTNTDVIMVKRYHADYFDKDLYTPESAAMALARSFPDAVDGDIDAYIATTSPRKRWTGFNGTPAVLTDGAAFTDAEQALSLVGYQGLASTWDYKAMGTVRSLLNENTQRSIVNVPITDGITVGSSTARFRNLKLADAARLGYLYDPRAVKIWLRRPEQVDIVVNDVTTQAKNAFYAKIEYTIGVAADQRGVVPLNAAPSGSTARVASK